MKHVVRRPTRSASMKIFPEFKIVENRISQHVRFVWKWQPSQKQANTPKSIENYVKSFTQASRRPPLALHTMWYNKIIVHYCHPPH